MKRFLALFALVMLTLGAAGLSQPARAAVTCLPVNNGGGTAWPTAFTFDCTGGTSVSSDANSMYTVLYNSRWESQQEFTQYTTKYYLFKNPADYHTYATAQGLTYVAPGAKDFGVTVYNSHRIPVYAAMFQTNASGGLVTGAPFGSVFMATAYEKSKAIDYLDGYVMTGGMFNLQSATHTISEHKLYADNLTKDWAELNQASNVQCGGTGLFTNRIDVNGALICTNGNGNTLTAPYAGLNNQQILQKAWPEYFTPTTEAGKNAFLANELTIFYNAGLPTKSSFPFTFHFKCTQYVASYVGQTGIMPPVNDINVPTGCVAADSTQITNCAKDFQGGQGYFTYGYVFDCETPRSRPLNGDIDKWVVGLSALGSNGNTTPLRPIQGTLISKNGVVYRFKTYQDYANAVTYAGLPQGLGNNGAAESGPFIAMLGEVQTLLPSENFGNPPSVSLAIEATTHELGHQTDYDKTWSTQSNSGAFDDAMQNDFVNLDYDTVSPLHQRDACAIKGMINPKTQVAWTYTGPLVNVIDAVHTLQQQQTVYFCKNGVLNADWAPNPNAPPRTSSILRTAGVAINDNFHQQPAGPNGDQQYPGGWSELYAQAFAIQAKPDTGGDGADLVVDQIVANGYFQCTAGNTGVNNGTINGWLSQIYKGVTPVMPNACKAANLPTGWTRLH